MSKRLEPTPPSRRDFIGQAGIWAAATAIFGSVVGMLRLPKPRVLPEEASRFSIGQPDEFPAGTERIIPERNVLLIASEQGIAAISLVCTHLGCVVVKNPSKFTCPCHGSEFDLQGKVITGPAPRALPWLEISRRADGKLLVNAKREVSAGTFYQL